MLKQPSTPRHFLSLFDLNRAELQSVIRRANILKSLQRSGHIQTTLAGKVLAMLFDKASTRTRVSFEAGIAQLGGSALFLSPRDMQLGRGESLADSARVISSMVDVIMIRTFEHARVSTFAKHSQVPVINGLTDWNHPCQLLADMQTYAAHRGDITGHIVTWIGDGNNMCHTYIEAAQQFGFELRIACPAGYEPDTELLKSAEATCRIVRNPQQAVTDAHLVVTDTWVSMGQENTKNERQGAFAPYKVTTELLALAASDALFMHCLPAYRGLEVSADVLDGPHSVVWEEAENRLHAQKALMEFLLCGEQV
ncbi:MAG: ornithine carbamoyltransferase [Pseudomonadota bacterium]